MRTQHTHRLAVFFFAIVLFSSCKKDETPEYIIERGTVTDVEGNVYQTVKIGNQWWMAENLIVAHFNDGSAIGDEINLGAGADLEWASATAPAYCIDAAVGTLYNSYVVTSEKNIAPAGWHVPTDEEWKELERTIGMTAEELNYTGWRGTVEGNALASKNREGWGASSSDSDLYGTDYFGFNAIPAGVRGHDGRTNTKRNSVWWWSKSTVEAEVYYRSMDSFHTEIFRHSTYPTYGMSIRCIKD
jgi:uncharacterized protein (TIGR02145 family)